MPIETVWKRYSTNGESLVSGVASVGLHGAALLLILVGIRFLFWDNAETQSRSVPEIEIVAIGDGKLGGGGGDPDGAGLNRVDGSRLRIDTSVPIDPGQKASIVRDPSGEDVRVRPGAGPTITEDELNMSWIRQVERKPGLASIGPLMKDLRAALSGFGHDRRGSGGGSGGGNGPGRGPGDGPGTGGDLRRLSRNQRWDLNFGDLEAGQYLARVQALDMYLAVPDGKGRLMLIRDLRNPTPEYADVIEMKRNWFIDDNAESCESVARILRLERVPSALIFFYPHKLEEELVAKERAFRGLSEELIDYTKFRISFRAGNHVISVMEQRRKK